MESPAPAPPPPVAPPPADERQPAWLVWLGGLALLIVLLWAAFSLGVFVAERGLTRPTLPPWPAPPATGTRGPTLPPLPTPVGVFWPADVATAAPAART